MAFGCRLKLFVSDCILTWMLLCVSHSVLQCWAQQLLPRSLYSISVSGITFYLAWKSVNCPWQYLLPIIPPLIIWQILSCIPWKSMIPPFLHSSLPWSDLIPHHILLITTIASSLVTSLYKFVFTMLQVFFLNFGAEHVILRQDPVFASAEHLKHFIIWPDFLAPFLHCKPMATIFENPARFSWQISVYPSRLECLFFEAFPSVFRQSPAFSLCSYAYSMWWGCLWWMICFCVSPGKYSL